MFEIGRLNGKSDAEILLEVVNSASPGEVLTYGRLAEALGQDSPRQYAIRDVQGSVNRAERKLAVHASRALVNVRRVGYKLALAEEHQKIAGRKRERSTKLLKRGLTVLQNVRWEEMDANQRQAHEGALMVVSALHQAVQGIESRLAAVESAIERSRD